MIAGVCRTPPPPVADKLCNLDSGCKRVKLNLIVFHFPTLLGCSIAGNGHLIFSGRNGIQLSQKLTHDIDANEHFLGQVESACQLSGIGRHHGILHTSPKMHLDSMQEV